jgi:MFS transporter, DHA2 family, multidrug resistance protein
MSAPPPLTGARRGLTAVAIALGTFMQVLDTSIANVSLPTMAGSLGVSPDQATWVITSFAVANGVSVPLTGWLMLRYGAVRTFVASVGLFTLASFLCGASWSLGSIVFFRVFQGAVSGPLIPGSQALLIQIFPPQKRNAAFAIWSMTTLVAPICGPVFGGYISDNWSWPWIFYINVPVGVLGAVICWRNLRDRETERRVLPVDSMGFAMLVVWVGALQIMLDQGKDLDWFQSTEIVVLALIAGIVFLAWVIWEATEEHPIVDLSIFMTRNFGLGSLAFALGYAIFFGNGVLLPLWLQTQLSYTATWAGFVSAPSGVVAILATPLAARMMAKGDARWAATISLVAFSISYFMRADLTADATFVDFVLPLLVQGIGISIFFVALVAISLQGVAPQRVPMASGLSAFARITAGSFAASITTTLWDRREALHQTRLAETTSVLDPAFAQTMAQLHTAGFGDAEGLAVLLRQLIGQSYVLASQDFFWISGWLFIVLIPVVWAARRSLTAGPAAAD